MRGHRKHRHNLSHHFIAYRCHLGLRIQFTPASEENGVIFEKIVAGVTGLEPATSCVTGRRSNQLSYTPDKGRENVAEVFSRKNFCYVLSPLVGGVAQLVRAPACHAGGCGFKSRHSRHYLFKDYSIFFTSRGELYPESKMTAISYKMV